MGLGGGREVGGGDRMETSYVLGIEGAYVLFLGCKCPWN